MFAFLDHM